ncbi:MAG: hypothetical protein Q7T82_19525 [Armatimonadota bacterium]|nr:hypothetical protein [Armatimonadota bacterium]
MISVIAFWMFKWFATLLAFGCFGVTARDVFRQSTGRVDFFKGTLDAGGSMFAFAFFTAVAFALWIA